MNADLLDSNVSLNEENLRSSRTPRIKHQKFVFKNEVVEKSDITSLDSTVMMQGSPRGTQGGMETQNNRGTSSRKYGSFGEEPSNGNGKRPPSNLKIQSIQNPLDKNPVIQSRDRVEGQVEMALTRSQSIKEKMANLKAITPASSNKHWVHARNYVFRTASVEQTASNPTEGQDGL